MKKIYREKFFDIHMRNANCDGKCIQHLYRVEHFSYFLRSVKLYELVHKTFIETLC